LRGRRVHKNYKSAYDEKEKVHEALSKRVRAAKTTYKWVALRQTRWTMFWIGVDG
jgi:hypothetical protein